MRSWCTTVFLLAAGKEELSRLRNFVIKDRIRFSTINSQAFELEAGTWRRTVSQWRWRSVTDRNLFCSETPSRRDRLTCMVGVPLWLIVMVVRWIWSKSSVCRGRLTWAFFDSWIVERSVCILLTYASSFWIRIPSVFRCRRSRGSG